jgi:hypothetical protein
MMMMITAIMMLMLTFIMMMIVAISLETLTKMLTILP